MFFFSGWSKWGSCVDFPVSQSDNSTRISPFDTPQSTASRGSWSYSFGNLSVCWGIWGSTWCFSWWLSGFALLEADEVEEGDGTVLTLGNECSSCTDEKGHFEHFSVFSHNLAPIQSWDRQITALLVKKKKTTVDRLNTHAPQQSIFGVNFWDLWWQIRVCNFSLFFSLFNFFLLHFSWQIKFKKNCKFHQQNIA